MQLRENIRNIAIIAHVDHGKTTLVDFMLRQTGTFRSNQEVGIRVMDSNDLEKERGITILAKNTSIFYRDKESQTTYKINIVDTPGHSDFSGEVERTLQMVNGVLLLVDAAEGPLPGTRFVLKKALELKLQPIVVINKIDRKDARPYEVLDEIFELFMALGADDTQLEFPLIYAIGRQGIAKYKAEDGNNDLEPLFQTIIHKIPAPLGKADAPFRMLVNTIDYNDYLGRMGIGRVYQGAIRLGSPMKIIRRDGKVEDARVTKLYTFEGLKRIEINEADTGEIVVIAGMADVDIGETIADAAEPVAIPFVSIEEPTLSMHFVVNNSPFSGQEGQFVTTSHLRERLLKELRSNVSLRVELTDSPDTFKVSGRGELHLGVLIETMRREGYEFQVTQPEVILKTVNHTLCEPIEHAILDIPEEYVGVVMENLGRRKAELKNMLTLRGNTRLEFLVPSRGLIGFRSEFLNQTKGLGICHHTFHGYAPHKGEITRRNHGAIVVSEDGVVVGYALWKLEDRGVFFVEPGLKVYAGMIVGEHTRDNDIVVNVTRGRHITNVRKPVKEEAVRLEPPRILTLEQAIEWIIDDEYVEVTPKTIRLRKKFLKQTDRTRLSRNRAKEECA